MGDMTSMFVGSRYTIGETSDISTDVLQARLKIIEKAFLTRHPQLKPIMRNFRIKCKVIAILDCTTVDNSPLK